MANWSKYGIDEKVVAAFNQAMIAPENIKSDGEYIWDFVAADVFIECKDFNDAYLDYCIDQLIEQFLKEAA